MKRILGLDLGVSSIGWALVNEAENDNERSEIIKLGVRVNPLTVDEQSNFESGKSITTNAERTLKRSMRRNLQRYKLRRENLIEVLKQSGWITDETILAEHGNRTTFETLRLRAKAAVEEISLEELARVLLMINKKRGYKSNRKVKNDEDGQVIDSMDIAKEMYDNHLTPGEYAYQLLSERKSNIPDFYRSDLQGEFDRVWEKQKEFYPEILTDELRENLSEKNEKQTWAICQKPFNIEGIKRSTKGKELIKENYEWRVKALTCKLDLEQLAIVLQKINSQIRNSSGYLGNISDRSKELYFKNQTVGQYLVNMIDKNPCASLKNQVFYRQDYIDEFEKIWETQSKFHPELTAELKKELRDIVIFYQRPLKSQKGLVSICELEQKNVEITGADGKKRQKKVGPKVCPKSSPLFQEFRIWQTVNNLKVNGEYLSIENRQKLAAELSIKEKMSKAEVLKLLFENPKDLDLNFPEIKGNRTNASLFKAYSIIIEMSGHEEYDFTKMPSEQAIKIVTEVFSALGINTDIIKIDVLAEDVEKQPLYRLWHLLYSYVEDKSKSGNESLVEKISGNYGFDKEYAKLIANVSFEQDYGNLSSKAIKKLLPYMKAGQEYSEACKSAGYRHSAKSLTKEEIESKEYKDKIEQVPKNSLRNTVVEKILNQMVNVVNAIIDEYGKPDEIRIELARELKKSQQERESMTKAISTAASEHEKHKDKLKDKFGIQNPSRNDIIRYKLYKELETRGFKTLYSDTYIPEEKLFSKDFDIEHIIPQAKRFDDSFSNKTIEARQVNIDKSDMTALDFVKNKYGENGVSEYRAKVEKLFKEGKISKTKRDNLLTEGKDIPEGFINRDIRGTQYIAKKAKEMLEDLVKSVVSTTGSVTDRLREDWQLVDVMKELNWDKYDKKGLTETYQDKDGRIIRKIKDWTKRNDHRHHAMDALTIAFTKRSFIQYLNNLNARIEKGGEDYVDLSKYDLNDIPKEDRSKVVRAIESTQLYRDSKGRLRFRPPIPLNDFRDEAKRHIESILVSIKAKNKVVTRNVNVTKNQGGKREKVQLTPRGQLHNETIYGSIKRYVTKEEKVGGTFNAEKINTVTSEKYKKALLERLNKYGGDPKKAFSGKNSLDKNPVFIDELQTSKVPEKVKTLSMETVYTIKKPVTADNFKDEKKIGKIIDSRIKKIMLERLREYGGDAKKAFSNIDENPIWQNKEKGISIKSVTISGVNNVEALHDKRDHYGRKITGSKGEVLPSDFVSTSNNHHIAIFEDADGNLQEQVVSFYEAVSRVQNGQPIIDREYRKNEGWKFLFTMKQNEYFVFPNAETGFDPDDIELTDSENHALISPNLFRVQKLTSKDYFFRHHLETNVENNAALHGITWKRLGINGLKGIVKVRVNHIGEIVQVGE